MQSNSNVVTYLVLFVLSGAVCSVSMPVIRRLAFLLGAIDMPGGRRLHQVPTPRLGGIGILIAIATGLAVTSVRDPHTQLALTSTRWLGAIAAVALVAFAGITDDVVGLSALTKLAVEVFAACLAFSSGYRIDMLFNLSLGWMSIPATIAWIVVVTNAFNLIDGMDGLAAGVGTIIGAALLVFSLSLRSQPGAWVLAALTGALLGFLPFNVPPARMFLGDGGSLSIGLILALVSVDTSNKLAAGIAIAVPIVAMGFPLAEITITVLRRMLRRIHVVRRDGDKERYEFLFAGNVALFSADRDHIHHRLLSLGLSKERVILTLYLATLLACGAGFGVAISRGLNRALLLGVSGATVVIAVRRLGYEELRPFNRGTLMPIFDSRGINVKPVHVLVDLVCICLSHVAAFAIIMLTEGLTVPEGMAIFLPLASAAQLSVLILSGLYRRSYRYAAVADVGGLVRSVGLAGLTGFVTVWMIGGKPAVTVAILDTYFLGTLIFGSRLSFRLLDHARSGNIQDKRAVLIYGAGRAGIVALSELRSNPELHRFAVGFLDDDSSKQGSRVSGLPVYGADSLSTLIEGDRFAELLVASSKISEERLRDISFRCASAGIPVQRLALEWREIPLATLSASPMVSESLLVQLPAGQPNP
jgi:UDP-GlcNAc:undecaprenyl-phosphate GlcNAc-1-phosphate transferase